MSNEIQKLNPNYPNVKLTDKFILRCGYQETELNAEEYCFVDSLLQEISKGNVNPNSIYRRKSTGESFNLSHFQYLIRKKSSVPKVFGEDIQL